MTLTQQTLQEPNDTSSETNALSFLFSQLLAKTFSAGPVKVLGVSGGSGALGVAGTVDVQPLVNQVDGTGAATPHGTIYNLQYFRLQGGPNAIIIDPKVGDIGLAVYCDRDISSVVANRGQANPGSWRRNSASDGIYLGGVINLTPTQYIQFAAGIFAGTPVVTTTGNLIVGTGVSGTWSSSSGQIITALGGIIVDIDPA